MGTLQAADVAKFEEHLFVCQECRTLLESTEQYVHAMGNAVRRLRGGGRKNTFR